MHPLIPILYIDPSGGVASGREGEGAGNRGGGEEANGLPSGVGAEAEKKVNGMEAHGSVAE